MSDELEEIKRKIAELSEQLKQLSPAREVDNSEKELCEKEVIEFGKELSNILTPFSNKHNLRRYIFIASKSGATALVYTGGSHDKDRPSIKQPKNIFEYEIWLLKWFLDILEQYNKEKE